MRYKSIINRPPRRAADPVLGGLQAAIGSNEHTESRSRGGN